MPQSSANAAKAAGSEMTVVSRSEVMTGSVADGRDECMEAMRLPGGRVN